VTGETGAVRVCGLYLPNGNPAPGPKYDYKLAWMERLRARAGDLLATEMPVVLAGDYNVIPQDEDAARPEAWAPTRSACPRAAPPSAASCISASPRPSAPAAPRRGFTPSGTIRPARGSGTTASASTTSC
jgi:hypothetical protein